MLSNFTEYLYDANATSVDYETPRHPGDLTGVQRAAAAPKTLRVTLQDVSFLKLREATLTFQLPPSMVHRFWAGSRYVRLNLGGRNLLTFTPYRTGDPEVNGFVRSAAKGVPFDLWAYPPSRSFWFSVDLGM